MSYLAHILPWAERRTAPAHGPMGTLAAAKKLWGMFTGAWQRVLDAKDARSAERRLRVVERVALGDKQFVALLELDGATYLASGGQGVPLSVTPAHKIAAPEATRTTSAPGPAHAPQAADEKPKRSRAKNAAPLQDSAARETAAKCATTSVAIVMPEKVFDRIEQPAEVSVDAVARLKRKRKPSATEPKLCARCAASLAGETVARSIKTTPVSLQAVPSQVSIAAPEVRTGTQSGPLLPESEAAIPSTIYPTNDVGMPPDETASEPGTSASTAFAALLELRMLASQVFEELDGNPDSKYEVAAQTAIAPAQSSKSESVAVQGLKKPNGIVSRLHRVRGRLSAYACLLVLFLLPHGVARGQSPPGLTAIAGHTASVARGSPFELGAVGVNFLAAAPLPNGDIHITGLGGSSASWSIVVLLTLLTLIPALLLCITPFARLLIVFHFLRQALGLQTTPSNQTLIGLSLILTFFLMQPTGEVIYRDAIVPAQAGKLTPLDAVVRAGDPMRHFMAHYVREKDAELFLEIAKEPRPRTVEDMSFRVLLPSYILSELKAGFQIGTVLFLPFLIVDMVVASITTSVGMMQLPPVVISTPLKLLLFLMVDGWHLLIGALMRSFN